MQDDFRAAQRCSAVIQGKSQIELREFEGCPRRPGTAVASNEENKENEEKLAVSAARRSLSLPSLGSFAQDFRLQQSADDNDNDDPE
jgi:hypothetical protein